MVNTEEKRELLKGHDNITESYINLSVRDFLTVITIFFVMLLILAPKIYIQNSIYYESKVINKYYNQYLSLKEENSALRQQLEDIKFRNQILDYIH
jgi:cell division protein FtsB